MKVACIFVCMDQSTRRVVMYLWTDIVMIGPHSTKHDTLRISASMTQGLLLMMMLMLLQPLKVRGARQLALSSSVHRNEVEREEFL